MNTTVTQPAALPYPTSHPEADVVVYDGHCRICSAQVERLARFDGGGRLSFVSLHDPLVGERYADLSHDDLMSAMYVITVAGERHRGVAAIRYLTRRLPKLWWLAPLLHLPGTLPLWSWMYRQFAKYRYRFGRLDSSGGNGCDGDACRVHFQ